MPIVMYETIFAINIIIYARLHFLIVCEFEAAVIFKERICSPKECAPFRILNVLLNEFTPFRTFCTFVFI